MDGGAYGAPIPLVGGRAVAPPVDDLDGNVVVAAHYHGYGPFESSTATLHSRSQPALRRRRQRGCVHVGPHPDPPVPGDSGAPIDLTPPATLVIDAAAVRVDGHGTARLPAECRAPAGQRCTGALTLRLAQARRSHGRVTVPRGTVVAGRRVELPAGARIRLAVDLTRQGERLLAGRRALRTELRADGMALDGGSVVLRTSRAHALRCGAAP